MDDIAENMKNNGGFIPGIRPGKPTIDYLNRILSRLTLAGALFLSVIVMISAIVMFFMKILKRQLESNLVMRTYQGFLK